MEQHRNAVRNLDSTEGTWLVAITAAGSFLGRLGEPLGEPLTTDLKPDVFKDHFTLNPCLNMYAPFEKIPLMKNGRPVAGPDGQMAMGIHREPVVTPFEFTLMPAPVHVPGVPHGTVVCFFDDMHENDRRSYRSMVEATFKQIQHMRAQAMGITLPSNGVGPHNPRT